MQFAPGMQEAMAMKARFADTAEEAAFWAEGAPDLPVEDHVFDGAAGQSQALRFYRGGGSDAPLMIYLHGGGWTGGSIALNEWVCRWLAQKAGANVISLSYRLSPAHPFPAGLEDCRLGIAWVRTWAEVLGVGQGTWVISGSSAGGNLAAACLLAGDRFDGAVLFYPVTDCDLETGSYRTYANGPGLTRARMAELFDLYDPTGQIRVLPLISPARAETYDGFPPTCLIAAEHDVLLDDSRALHAALSAAGVPSSLHIEPGVTHGYINRGRLVPAVQNSIDLAARFLAEVKLPEKTQ